MKKTVSLLLCVLLTLMLLSCAASSNVTVADVKEEMCDENWTVEERSPGLVASVDLFTEKATLTATANGSGKVSKIVVTATDLDKAGVLRSSDLLTLVSKVTKDPGSLTAADFRVAKCVLYALSLEQICRGEGESTLTTIEVINFFVNGTTLTVNGWTITNSVDTAAKTCTVTAVYN